MEMGQDKRKIITSKRYSIVSEMAFEIYAQNHDLNVLEECLRIDKETYYGMNILDYLVGNIDRHPKKRTQREAAIEAVRNIGLHQIKNIDEALFEDKTEWKAMFFRRLEELKNAVV